ncbi:hypothetical protein F8388_000055 [Cannabis sativa]|uniref:Retrotransposon Copia-like N-terminal domain-containing protein n=1 Tax=Cannabis sativa TaxID=3483 RepID=A0A7J6EPG0_CANSA|nr:hypothetical protein F8388_000055 [Cannabis sativa]
MESPTSVERSTASNPNDAPIDNTTPSIIEPTPAPAIAPSPFQSLAPLTIKLDRTNYPYWKSQALPALRAHDLEEMMESHSTLKNTMDESSRGLFNSVPYSFKKIMAPVILRFVEKLYCLIEAAILGIIFIVVVRRRESAESTERIRTGRGFSVLYWEGMN